MTITRDYIRLSQTHTKFLKNKESDTEILPKISTEYYFLDTLIPEIFFGYITPSSL
jgi:hypothetical protein